MVKFIMVKSHHYINPNSMVKSNPNFIVQFTVVKSNPCSDSNPNLKLKFFVVDFTGHSVSICYLNGVLCKLFFYELSS